MATIPELIRTKRDGQVLSDQDIETFVRAVTSGSIQEAQIGAERLGNPIPPGRPERLTVVFFCGQVPCSWPSGRWG